MGALPNEADREGQTALHRASERGNMAVVDSLVRGGADLNASRSVANLADGETVEHTPILRAYVRGRFPQRAPIPCDQRPSDLPAAADSDLQSLCREIPRNDRIRRVPDPDVVGAHTNSMPVDASPEAFQFQRRAFPFQRIDWRHSIPTFGPKNEARRGVGLPVGLRAEGFRLSGKGRASDRIDSSLQSLRT